MDFIIGIIGLQKDVSVKNQAALIKHSLSVRNEKYIYVMEKINNVLKYLTG